MKAIVFGGSGFLGSHVADVLSERGYETTIFDIQPSRYLIEHQKMVVGDILDEDAVMAAVKGQDFVYDFAGVADLDGASTRPADTILYNVIGACNIMHACVKHKAKRFVYASSFYANSDKGGFYRCSKQAAELYIEEYQRKFGLDYTILRYGSLYGPRAGKTNGIREMLESSLKDGLITYYGTGDERREYIHVRDAAALSVKILEEDYINKHIVLTGHESYRIKDMVKIISEILKRPIETHFENENRELHYAYTPYRYRPHGNYKLVNNFYHDIGQGLIECLRDIEGEKLETVD